MGLVMGGRLILSLSGSLPRGMNPMVWGNFRKGDLSSLLPLLCVGHKIDLEMVDFDVLKLVIYAVGGMKVRNFQQKCKQVGFDLNSCCLWI